MWLWRVNTDAVLRAMGEKRIDSFQDLRRRAEVSKETMTKIANGGCVQEAKLKQVARVLKVKWDSLHSGQVYCTPGPRRSRTRMVDDIRDQVGDALAAFGRLAAWQTNHDPDGIRCLAYLFEEKVSRLMLLGVYTGSRTVDDRAREIPPRHVSDDEEKDWYIVFRAFRDNEYVCDNVNWEMARNRQFRTCSNIWERLRGVVAYPMRPRDGRTEPIGVVCVDSAQLVEQAGWTGSLVLQRTLESLGEILYVMVADTGFVKRRRRGTRKNP